MSMRLVFPWRPARLVLLVLALLPASAAGPPGSTRAAADTPGSLDRFAQCLAEKKATMYGAFWCDHCQEQKDLFGPSFKYVPYVECVEKGTRRITPQCSALGIRKTPTWIFADGERRQGVQPLAELSKKTGCPLP